MSIGLSAVLVVVMLDCMLLSEVMLMLRRSWLLFGGFAVVGFYMVIWVFLVVSAVMMVVLMPRVLFVMMVVLFLSFIVDFFVLFCVGWCIVLDGYE